MTMASTLDRVPVEQISARAEQIKVGRGILAVIGGLLYVVGYVPAKLLRGLAWMGSAVAVGWSDGRAAPKPAGGADG